MGQAPQCLAWVRAVLAALALAAPGMPAAVSDRVTPAGRAAAVKPAALQYDDRPAITDTTRFSDLTEVTPSNVAGLLPLVTRSAAVLPRDSPLDPSSAIDMPLQRFMDERIADLDAAERDHAHGGPRPSSRVITYLIGGAGDGKARTARTDLTQHELRAWDPIERHLLWSVHESLPISSGTLITAGGLVFYGTGDGWFKALDARSGRVLWKHRVDGSLLRQPASYRGADGHQYIAVRARPRGGGAAAETVLLFALAH